MSYKIILKKSAQMDLNSHLEWFQEENAQQISLFLEIIDGTLKKIQLSPKHFQIRYEKLRIAFTKRFSYGMYFTIENECIYIHAILHTKQDNQKVFKRI